MRRTKKEYGCDTSVQRFVCLILTSEYIRLLGHTAAHAMADQDDARARRPHVWVIVQRPRQRLREVVDPQNALLAAGPVCIVPKRVYPNLFESGFAREPCLRPKEFCCFGNRPSLAAASPEAVNKDKIGYNARQTERCPGTKGLSR